jgi:hypothetical protein
MPAGAVQVLLEEMAQAKRHFGLPEDAPVISCYEAGRDGFWLHRFLGTRGVENHVIDSASIEVNRRHRRAKTDRLDVHKLLTMLLRHVAGEPKVWSAVRVPSEVDEDRRQLHWELLTAKRDRTRVINRMKGLLAGVGIQPALAGEAEAQLEQVRQFATLRGIGINSAWLFVMEFFAWGARRLVLHSLSAPSGWPPAGCREVHKLQYFVVISSIISSDIGYRDVFIAQ